MLLCTFRIFLTIFFIFRTQALRIFIEGLRAEFQQCQARLRDIKREHDDLRLKIPSCFFVGSRPEMKVIIVTSGNTEKAFSTGQENNVEVFK